MSFLVNKNKLATTHTITIKLKDCVPIFKKNIEDWDFYFKIVKKSLKFRSEWGQISAPENTKNPCWLNIIQRLVSKIVATVS